MGGWGGGGLSYYDPGEGHAASLHNYTMEHGLLGDYVMSIVEDDAGRLWIGTLHDGLCCFDGNKFISYGEGIPPDRGAHQWSVRDVNGQLWFGTSGDGVYRYDGRHFQQLCKADGLPSNSITGFVPQHDGSMIIGTRNGIVHYRPTATVPPRIEIREVVADGVYSYPSILELTTTGADLVAIAYHGLSLSTHRMCYSYILEGHDKEWRDTWESQVRYEKLPPGEYTFRVIAINRDLVCSEAPATLQLTVVPDPRDEHIARLESELEERERAEMERIYSELEDARQIQQSLLPEEPPQMEGFEISGTSIPAREVSGDFYNYLSLGNNIGLVIADVTGKSVKAAMVAAMTSGMLNTAVEVQRNLWNSPGGVLGELNTRLKPHLMRGMYTAMSLGVLQAGNNRLVFSNSGMPYPIVKRGKEAWELEVNGLPLGIMDGVEYDELSFDLKTGDFVVFYSDGLIEAENEAEEMYQTEQLLEVLCQSNLDLSAQEMVALVIKDVHTFVGNLEPYDDITVVVVRVM